MHFSPPDKKRALLTALALGVSCAVVNFIIAEAVGSKFYLPVGNIALFVAAIALGAPGALAAVAAGVLPESLLTGDHVYGLRMLTVCAAVGYFSRKHPKIPAYVVCFCVWVFSFGPGMAYLRDIGAVGSWWSAQYIVFAGLWETLACIFAGSILLHPHVWSFLSFRVRHLSVQNILEHLLPLFCLSILALAWTVPSRAVDPVIITVFYAGHALELLLVALLVLTISWFVGRFGSHFLLRELEERGLSKSSKSSILNVSSSFRVETSSAESSTPKSWVSSKIDISELERDEELNSALFHLDKSGKIVFANDRFCDLVRINRDKLVEHMLASIPVASELLEPLQEVIASAWNQGTKVSEIRVNQLPDPLRFYEVKTRKEQGISGEDLLVVSMRNITDRRTVESHLLQAQKAKSLGNAIGGLAHAFNNFLTTIVGQASFARRSQDPELVSKSLEAVIEAANDASTLVWKLLEFSEGKPNLAEPIDLSKFISSRIDFLQKIVGDKYELNFQGSSAPLGIHCDPSLLMQAITNLILNAKEAYQDGDGAIWMNLETEVIEEEVAQFIPGARCGEFVRLRIKDQGCGMGPEVLSRAFEPLFTTKSGAGQAGLGLSIVFAIVRANDGFLVAESEPEHGTTISVYLPVMLLDADESERSQEKARPGPVPSANHESILVVEDQDAVRELVAKMLETLGYKVESAPSGAEALKICESKHFDLVLVDMMMPRMSGTDLIGKLKDSDQTTKALLMTGYGVTQRIKDCGSEVLMKPFDMETLALRVRRALE